MCCRVIPREDGAHRVCIAGLTETEAPDVDGLIKVRTENTIRCSVRIESLLKLAIVLPMHNMLFCVLFWGNSLLLIGLDVIKF